MKTLIQKERALVFTAFQVPLPQNTCSCLVRSVELVNGRAHFRRLKGLIEQAGLEKVLKRKRIQEKERDCLKSGNVKK